MGSSSGGSTTGGGVKVGTSGAGVGSEVGSWVTAGGTTGSVRPPLGVELGDA